jgi:hypothetical protein
MLETLVGQGCVQGKHASGVAVCADRDAKRRMRRRLRPSDVLAPLASLRFKDSESVYGGSRRDLSTEGSLWLRSRVRGDDRAEFQKFGSEAGYG